MSDSKGSFRTRAVHVGNEVDPATGAVVPPVHFATTFRQPGAGVWGEFDYSRSGNPTRTGLQRTLASLEGGVGSLAFSTGMAAIHCVTMLLSPGDMILAGSDIYGGAYRLFHRICDRAGIGIQLVDFTDLNAIASAIRPETKLLWGETIGNPQMSILDLPEISRLAKDAGILFGVDNTFGTPALLRPLEQGVDIVMHSATKYLGGHSDCLGGTLAVSSQSLLDQLYFIQNATGAVLDPMSCFLLSRGIKTLDVRVRAQSETAMQLARWLSEHPRVSRVLYPGLEKHPGHALGQAADGRSFRRRVDLRFQGHKRADGDCVSIDQAVLPRRELGSRRIVDRTTCHDVARQLCRCRSRKVWNHRWPDSVECGTRII
jgi:cystathionine gamma-lyase